MSAIIQIRGLSLTDPGGHEVREIDFEIEAGEATALLGDDQVVLTRMIRVIGGLDRPDAGTVIVAGVDVGTATREELQALRRRVGYVSVAGGLLSNMTVRANLELALRYHGQVPPNSIRARADSLLAEVGLSQCGDRPASVIPAELQKCAAYVRAVACEPDLLLVEDPAAFLHPEGRAAIERVHARLADRGTTVLLADDDVDLAGRLARRAIWFTGGIIAFDGPFSALPDSDARTGQTEIP